MQNWQKRNPIIAAAKRRMLDILSSTAHRIRLPPHQTGKPQATGRRRAVQRRGFQRNAKSGCDRSISSYGPSSNSYGRGRGKGPRLRQKRSRPCR